MKPRVPLAWLNLTHDRRQLALSAAGIGFAVVLMFVQYGFRNALLDSNVLLIDRFNADLVLVNRKWSTLALPEPIARSRLARARAVPGVRAAYPLYVEYHLSELQGAAREGGRPPRRSVRVLGVDPDAYLLDFPELAPPAKDSRSCVADLKVPGRALFDRQGKHDADRPGESVFGPLGPGCRTELAGQEVRIAGGFDLGSDFGAEGTLIVSSDTFARLLRHPFPGAGDMDEVDFGLLRLEPGADPADVQKQVRSQFPEGDVDALTPRELAERERSFWLHNTPIGFVFGFGVFMGFIVGTVICYQILASDVADHLAEYATLKAVGYSNRYLSFVVLQQALLLSLAGFVPGLAVAAGLYRLLARTTDLPVRLTPGRVGWVFLLTLAMCTASGLLALRKVQRVDPAEVF